MHGAEGWQRRYGRELPVLGELTIFGEMPILRETILGAILGRPDKPDTIVSHFRRLRDQE